MRQLKGKVSKENKKEKRERKKAFREGQNQALTIAVPVILGIMMMIVVFVMMKANNKV